MATVARIASLSTSNQRRKKGIGGEELMVGSVRWLAPETTASQPVFSEKSDAFGLGMVLWELASREIPFAEVSQEAQVIFLIKQEKERPKIPEECPAALASIILDCWEDVPEKRPTSGEILTFIESNLPTLTQTPPQPFVQNATKRTYY
jgi:serine/threonine protein kinase